MGFNALARGSVSQTGPRYLSSYLKYLLQLRFTYLKLSVAQIGRHYTDFVAACPQELTPLRTLNNLFVKEAISLAAGGGVSRAHKRLFFANFVKEIGRVLCTVRFVRKRYVYFTSNGVLQKISMRVALAFANSCFFRRTVLKARVRGLSARALAQEKLSSLVKAHKISALIGYRNFAVNLRSAPFTSRSQLFRARARRHVPLL